MILTLKNKGLEKINPTKICQSSRTINLPSQVDVFSLSHNKLSSLESLDTFNNLIVLDISHNQIKRLVHLPARIQVLIAHHNLLNSVVGLSSLPRLKELDVSSNKITSVKGLYNNKMLSNLKASNNQIINTQGLELLRNVIEEIDLSNNDLEKFKDLKNIQTMNKLRILKLKGNPIEANEKYWEKYSRLNKNLEWFDDKRVGESGDDERKKKKGMSYKKKNYGEDDEGFRLKDLNMGDLREEDENSKAMVENIVSQLRESINSKYRKKEITLKREESIFNDDIMDEMYPHLKEKSFGSISGNDEVYKRKRDIERDSILSDFDIIFSEKFEKEIQDWKKNEKNDYLKDDTLFLSDEETMKEKDEGKVERKSKIEVIKMKRKVNSDDIKGNKPEKKGKSEKKKEKKKKKRKIRKRSYSSGNIFENKNKKKKKEILSLTLDDVIHYDNVDLLREIRNKKTNKMFKVAKKRTSSFKKKRKKKKSGLMLLKNGKNNDKEFKIEEKVSTPVKDYQMSPKEKIALKRTLRNSPSGNDGENVKEMVCKKVNIRLTGEKKKK